MNGNGCAGSIASGVSTGNTRSMNHASSHFTSSADSSSGSHTSMPASRSRPRSSRHTRCCSASSDSARSLISASCCAGVRPSGETAVSAGLRLADQAGDAHRVELVQVGRADRDEAQPLQQRMARVLGLLHHAMVEVEPGQLAVDEPVGTVRRDRGLVGRRPLRRAVQHRRRPVAAREHSRRGAVFMPRSYRRAVAVPARGRSPTRKFHPGPAGPPGPGPRTAP